MRTEHAKGSHEVDVFAAFVKAATLPYDLASIEKRLPPEPDILACSDEGMVAFELVEICDQNIARFNATVRKGGVYYMRTADPTPQIIEKKLRCKYKTEYPIELLCYTAGRVVTPPNVIIPRLRPYLRSVSHMFRRAWLFSQKRAFEVWNGG